MKNKTVLKIFLMFTFLVISLNLIIAQTDKEKKQRDEHKKRWDRIEELKKIKMLEELDLPEDIANKFIIRYTGYRTQMKEIEKERASLITGMESLLKSGGNQSEISKNIEAIGDVEQKMSNNRKTFTQDLKNIISIEKTAKFFIFERNFQKEFQNILQDFQKRKMRPR
jgi:hypothetical protein